MAVAKRKTGFTAEKPQKKVKTTKEAKAAAPKKTIFGKALDEDLKDNDGDDYDEDEDEGELEAEPIRDDDEEHSMDADVPDQTAAQKNKLSSKESNAQKKALRDERRSHKPNAELIYPAKKLWEKLRLKELPKAERQAVMKDMMALITGKVQELIFKHDMSRIIQSCLKHGNEAQRNVIAGELVGHYLTLSKSMYGRFIVIKILNYCQKYREAIIKEFYGKVRQLIKHKEASSIIEDAYSIYANSAQRAALIQEFYGPEYRLFKTGDKKTLSEILEQNPAKKDTIMKHLMETLTGCLEKGTIGLSIVHRGLLEYFEHADAKGIQEMLDLMKEQAVEMLHTKEGAQVAMYCLLYATPKDRKAMLKTMKPFVVKICKEEYGHMVMLRMFDVVDDTVLMSKAILAEIIKEMEDIAKDKFGRRVILYLLAGRSPKYISPQNIELLAKGDAIRANTSKKDAAVRSAELLSYISPSLISLIATKARSLISEPLSSQVVLETMLHAVGDKTPAMNALLEIAAANPAESTSEEPNPLLTMPTDRLYKTLILSDYKAPLAEPSLHFAKALLAKISPYIGFYVLEGGNSAFIILALLENPETAEETKKLLISTEAKKRSSITLQKEMENLIKGKPDEEHKAVRLILEGLAK
ncbi:pumilio domain member 6 [Lobosporangium transversale]|uniref:Armadillo-type protein n=1 Tax=Lobosporangium transversale TaxID=64571 RepID=A0A1Y2G7J2_9FUNG|nr:armadillo-type protein [Lobosporangium transversale]KAF9914975.1 pumilio domain member 6 [Lobosporangium transversale]ORY99785.1 armadillo-type protein [Lobosporangium transversale]|eukprot:XP_021876019.1 armadillo-type protein [Lobosporangium transversale]